MHLPVPLGTLVIGLFAVLGIALPVVGLLVPLLPHVLAIPVALLKRDPHGPFVPRQRAMAALSAGVTCLILGLLLLVAVQPRFFRPGGSIAVMAASPGAQSLHAWVAPELTAAIDSIPCAGAVVGIVRPEGSEVIGFGRTSVNGNTPPDGRTVFEIGDLTGVFTTALFARLAEQGVVRVDESVQSLLPDSVSVPMYSQQPIELRHLATGSSGLPRLADPPLPGLDLFPPFSRAAPPRSTKWLHRTVSSIDIGQRPGTAYDGSDLGMGLLGHALSRATHTDYDTLLHREICDPLGLKDTRVRLTPDMRKRLAPGVAMGWGTYRGWRVASPTRRWPGGAIAGAADLHSTANDLIVFLWANLGLSSTPLSKCLEETQISRLRVLGKADVGLGWRIEAMETGESIVWQRGAAGASRSYLAFARSRGVGVVVLANSSIDAERLGRAILMRLMGPSV